MYILKNALKCIGRSKGRNLLIGIIVLVIAVSACLGLSIRQAAGSARTEALKGLSVTASITMAGAEKDDRMDRENFDPSKLNEYFENRNNYSGLTLEEYQTYAAIDTVTDFQYWVSTSMNAGEDIKPVGEESDETTEEENDQEENADSESETTDRDTNNPFGDFGGRPGGGMFIPIARIDSDFSVVGYNSDSAIKAQLPSLAITEGAVFAENTTDLHCIISSDLALYNNLAVNDQITLTNPNNEEESYTLTVVGIYTDDSATVDSFSGFGPGSGATSIDPANKIYMSHAALQSIVDASAALFEEQEDEEEQTGRALSGTLSATYVFANPDGYYTFAEKVQELGLDESYTVTSTDVESFETSLTPLNTLSKLATTFLIVILIIGAVILVVLNIFNIRERKYEIGVLTAMGMKKHKVALQLLSEIFIVTIIAVMLGATIGGVFSVPVTNALLADQVADQQNQEAQAEQDFGREGNFTPPDGGNFFGGDMSGMPNMGGFPGGGGNGGGGGRPSFGEMGGFASALGSNAETNYVTSVSSAMNLTVVWQMLGIAVMLTLVAGAVGMLFVMRYEPLKILANRD